MRSDVKFDGVCVCLCVCVSVWCRTAVRRGESIRYLVPDPVMKHIMKHKLYLPVTETDVT